MEIVVALLLAIALGITPAEISCEVSEQRHPTYHCEIRVLEYDMVIEGQVYVTRHVERPKRVETY